MCLHCTLVRMTPTISLPHPTPFTSNNYKRLHCFISYMYKKTHQPYSPSFILSMNPSPSHKYLPPHRIYFTVLSFIFHSKVSVQRSFSMFLSCEYTVFWSVQPSVTLPYFFPPIPYYSLAFSMYHYVIHLHRCQM
jgi:hypothetical protein